jgi:hypothetical protein
MNEEIPQLPPDDFKPQPSTNPPPPTAPNFWAMFGVGALLLIFSCILCGPFRSPAPFGIGALVAFVSLFFNGYRGIFIGFLASIGISGLVAALICGAMISSVHRS